MPAFLYKGRDQRGVMVNGRLEATTPDAVASQLFNRGITPIDITVAHIGNDVFAGLRERMSAGSIDLTDLIFFCRQMYTLQRAGVPILQAMRGLSASARNPALARVIDGLAETLDAGQELSAALKRYPKIFPPLFISLVQVGETTGSLDIAFNQLATYLELEKDTRQRVKAALRYPSFVLIAITAAIFIINLFVIPSFAKVYEGFNAELPLATKMIIATSNFTLNNWPLIFLGLLLTIVGAMVYMRSPAGAMQWDRFKLKLPVVGDILFRATLGRFARALAMTMKAGVPVVQGLVVVSRAVSNLHIGQQVLTMRDGLERGESLTRTAAATQLFPAIVLQMISVGEETGSLDELMNEVADFYEREVDYALKNLSAAIEPVLIVIVGVLVLILALGVFLPMWNLATATGL